MSPATDRAEINRANAEQLRDPQNTRRRNSTTSSNSWKSLNLKAKPTVASFLQKNKSPAHSIAA
jgi:hypothetical protein